MIAILSYAPIMKAFFLPPLWTVEMAQFLLVAYYILGGAWTLQLGSTCGWTCSTRAGRRAKARLRRHDHRRSA